MVTCCFQISKYPRLLKSNNAGAIIQGISCTFQPLCLFGRKTAASRHLPPATIIRWKIRIRAHLTLLLTRQLNYRGDTSPRHLSLLPNITLLRPSQLRTFSLFLHFSKLVQSSHRIVVVASIAHAKSSWSPTMVLRDARAATLQTLQMPPCRAW